MKKTRFLDSGLYPAAEKHIAECAEEMGVDCPIPVTNERKIDYKGRTIEVWYEETGSVYAWKAFVMGLGTFSGAGDDEAINKAKAKIDAD